MGEEFKNKLTQLFIDIAVIKEKVSSCEEKIQNLDERINGSFDLLHCHIKESDVYREMITKHDEKIKTLFTQIEFAAREKLNSTKNSQWRCSLITGLIVALVNIGVNILLKK